MEVLKLMNSNPNWKDILRADPYNITIKEDGEFVLLKYSQINSDFNLQIVRECRGAIFVKENDTWRCVRRAFDKFGNYGEDYAAQIDWSTSVVQEKIDGSLMSVWYYNGDWRISTNGTINAFKAPLGDTGLSFGEYFVECLNCSLEDFFETLDKNHCYTFEMIGPLNRVVVSYNIPKLYAIGQRNMVTMQECTYTGPLDEWCNIWLPKVYNLYTLDEVVKVANYLSKNEEGFVVKDEQFNRIKVKSPEYLIAARLHNNGVITTKRILEMIQEDTVDDFIAYMPQYSNLVSKVSNALTVIAEDWDSTWNKIIQVEENMENRKNFAAAAKNEGLCFGFLFKKYDGIIENAMEYLLSMNISVLKDLVEEKLNG